MIVRRIRRLLSPARKRLNAFVDGRTNENAMAVPRLRFLFAPTVTTGRDVRIARDATVSVSLGGTIAIGDETRIYSGAILSAYGGSIKIGRNCTVQPYCVLYGHGGLTIGDNVRIAAHSAIIPMNHVFERRDVPICDQGIDAKGIVIGDDVWIGSGARILDGVSIAKGCVIAAGAVVTSSTEAYGIYGGVPARRIGER